MIAITLPADSATFAYLGGFSPGMHNIFEASVLGVW